MKKKKMQDIVCCHSEHSCEHFALFHQFSNPMHGKCIKLLNDNNLLATYLENKHTLNRQTKLVNKYL